LLKAMMDRYGDNEVAALAAYNAGSGNADSWGGSDMSIDDIEFPETKAYVAEVLDKQREYRQKYGAELGY
jgi:soluble lytic murein transglycosylase